MKINVISVLFLTIVIALMSRDMLWDMPLKKTTKNRFLHIILKRNLPLLLFYIINPCFTWGVYLSCFNVQLSKQLSSLCFCQSFKLLGRKLELVITTFFLNVLIFGGGICSWTTLLSSIWNISFISRSGLWLVHGIWLYSFSTILLPAQDPYSISLWPCYSFHTGRFTYLCIIFILRPRIDTIHKILFLDQE